MRQRQRSRPAEVPAPTPETAPIQDEAAGPQVVSEPAEVQEPTELAGPPVTGAEGLAGAVEAILLSLDRPVTGARIGEALNLTASGPKNSPAAQVERAIEGLNRAYKSTGRSFCIERVAGGFRLMTLPAHAESVAAFHASRAPAKLSRAGVETLAIVAYRQPITRAELEAIRGVACGEVLKTLLERRLVEITGRAEELGRPMLYGTTKRFLESFGLASLKDLPSVAEFVGKG